MPTRNDHGYAVYEGEDLKKLQKMKEGTQPFAHKRPSLIGAVLSTSKMVLAIVF